MELARINTNLLVALDLLLTEENVARAADRHGVTPSAMSHSLRALRELFGDPLLVKTRDGMRATAFAQSLSAPLRRALRDLERAVSDGARFDPSTAERAFVVCAPDFLSTFLMPHVAAVLAEHAPKVEVEIRPVRRQGTALLLRDAAALAEGTIDLVVAAMLDELPELRIEALYEERFVCIVRKGHPLARRKRVDLESYAATPQLLITITDERSPTMVDAELARHGLTRRVALRTRYFMAAPLIVANSDLMATCPYQLARYFAARAPIAILEPPVALAKYSEYVAWHARYDADPGLVWLRGVLAEAAREALQRG